MRLVTVSLFITALLASSAMGSSVESYRPAFESFKAKYQRSYNSNAEEEHRLAVFAENMRKAERLQKLNPHAEFGANGYADQSEQEFKVKHSGEASFRAAMRKRASRTVDAAVGENSVEKIDWRTKGVVTPIKNQLGCGGCWSFSTTGNIEGQWALAGHGLVSLSEQELVSCDDTCNACHGGIMDDAFEWIINARGGGITSEAQYPFVSGMGVVPACAMEGKTPVAFISSYKDVAHSEAAMAEFVATKGPLSIAVDATSFQTYKGGIMSNCVANQVDHAVLIVGYDFTGPTKYWIVKNQWGTVWGVDGYIYLEYGTNQCLLTTLPSSSVVSNPPPVPPTGTPAPPSPPDVTKGTFTQYTCTSSSCLSGCTNMTLPNGKCLKMGAGSAISSCGTTYLHLEVYNSTDCTGPWQQGVIPLNQCVQQTASQYLYDTCTQGGSGSGSGSGPAPNSGSGNGPTPAPPAPSTQGSGSSSSGWMDESVESQFPVEVLRDMLKDAAERYFRRS